jgi:hypothetical protein
MYDGPAHQIIFTDTRTWRSFPNGNGTTGDLLPPDQMEAQIPLKPDIGDKALIVVLTTNAPPVQPIRGATRHDTITTTMDEVFNDDSHPDIFEAWEIPSLGFDRLLKRLTDKLNLVSGTRFGQVVLLSGDVHFGFASRLVYRATNRFEDTNPQPAHAVIAQLVASSYKKQDADTVGFQREGYFYTPHGLGGPLVFEDMTEGYAGWNVPASTTLRAGSRHYVAAGQKLDPGQVSPYTQAIRSITHDDPTIKIWPLEDRLQYMGLFEKLILNPAPHYHYRLDYLLPSDQGPENKFDDDQIPPLPGLVLTPEQRKAAMETFNRATAHYREHNKRPGRQKLIGRNNISELTFDWGKRDDKHDNKKVNHTLRWRYPIGKSDGQSGSDDLLGDVQWTTYTISLDPNDPKYEDLTAAMEGP